MIALPGPAISDEPAWPPGILLTALSGDWNDSGQNDLAVLVDDGNGAADLLIYAGAMDGLRLVERVPGAIVNGAMAGQRPTIEPRSASSFMLRVEWLGIGRTPWIGEVTIAHRSDAFVVAGFTHRFVDRLDPERHGRCDANLLSGSWEGDFTQATGQPTRQRQGQDGPRAFPVSALNEDYFPDVCLELFAE